MKYLLVLFSFSAHAIPLPGIPEITHRDYDFVVGDRVVVQNTSGKITVSPNDRARVVIAATKRTGSERCTIMTERSGDLTRVNVRVDRPMGEECHVDIELRLPAKTNLDLSSESGQIRIANISGELKFNVGAGTVVAQGNFKSIDGKAGSGDVEVIGLAGGGRLDVGSGSVNLRFLETPSTGDFELNTGAGDAVINLPRTSKINARLVSGNGDIESDVASDTAAGFNLNVKTGTGDLKVKAY